MSINALPDDYTGCESSPFEINFKKAKQLMVRRARELVDRLVEHRGTASPPFLAQEFAHMLHIKRIERTNLGDLDAVLVRSRDGHVIKLNASCIPARQNFSCAHEISHALLDEIVHQEFITDTEHRGATGIARRDKERLCNIAAAELLMPAPVFSKYLLDFGLCIDSVERLARIFKVSIPAAAIRVEEVSEECYRVIRWKRWERSKSKGFFEYRSKEEPEHTYVRDPSALLRAYQSDESVKSFKCFRIDNVSKRCLMESKGIGRDKDRYVLSLVFPDR